MNDRKAGRHTKGKNKMKEYENIIEKYCMDGSDECIALIQRVGVGDERRFYIQYSPYDSPCSCGPFNELGAARLTVRKHRPLAYIAKNRAFLMHQKDPDVYYILEENVDYIGAMHNGKPSIMNTECLYHGYSLWDLLYNIWSANDYRFLVKHDWTDVRNGRLSINDKQSWCRSLETLNAFAPATCNIRLDKNFNSEDRIGYCKELWILSSDEHAHKVRDWTEKADRELEEFIYRIGEGK